jgi:1-acyl-sn-glycerol-3-phosphate acyltransferase
MLARMSTPADTSPAPTHADADFEPWVSHDSRLVERIVRVLSIWWWDHVYRLRAYHVERVPTEGAFLLVPNHSSYTDPFLNARPLTRRVRFMAKDSMFHYPVMRTVMRGGGAFPVRRGKGDTFAMELARRLLLDGQPVVVYPEGTRFRRSLELGPAKRGAARLALETGVPVVPAAVWGVKQRDLYGRPRWRRPRAVLVYGEPMDFSHLAPTPEHVDEVRDAIWTRVHELYDEARERAGGR